MNVSPVGIACIQYFEKCRLTAYQDSGGVWTIGWGETSNVRPGMVWTQQQADEALKNRLMRLSESVTQAVAARSTQQHQFDAFVSFAYNVGLGAFLDSTLRRKHVAGEDATPEFYRWALDNGKISTGLANRRCAERLMYKGKDWSYAL